MQALVASSGLIGLPRRLPQGSVARCTRLTLVVSNVKGRSGPPVEAPSEAAAPPAQYAEDVPAYFQPTPVQPPQQNQVYQAVPQYGSQPPLQPSFWSGIPPIVYIGVGVVLGGVLNKVMEVVRGGPQKVQQMAMEQMMKQMMKQMGGAEGGASPFGAPGANPFAAGSPFGGASPFGTSSGFPPPGSSFPQPPAFDTTATPAGGSGNASAASPSSSSTSSTTAGKAADMKPGEATSGASSDAKPKKRSAFTDVKSGMGGSSTSADTATDGAVNEAASNTGSAAGAGSPPPFGGMPPPPFGGMPGSMPGGGAGAGAGGGAGNVAGTMLDMLKDPQMQKMLYPYLPEPMRNPETFEWMLNNPEYRTQLEGMLQQQAMASGSPAVAEMMQGMDMSPEKMQAQFEQLGMTPDQFLQKVMGDPDLSAMMTNPKVMAAIAECTKNPMAIFQYQNDQQVMRVFEKMAQIFPQAGGGFGGMPPGFGAQPPQQQ